MIRNAIAIVCLAVCYQTSAQVVRDSIKVEGNFRSFQFNTPVGRLNAPALVFVLHGSGGSGADLMQGTRRFLDKTANENAVFVYPDGYKRYWNECRKAASSLANKMDINEQAFFIDMIAYFKKKYNINEQHVYAVGTSGGGHMCYKLAMTLPDRIKAITAIIANLPADDNMDCTEARKALPVMIINGTADPLNKYEGGMMQSANFIMGNVRSTDNTFAYWSALAGYKGSPAKSMLPDTDPDDGKTIEQYSWKGKGKPEVTLLKVINGKHDYPNDIDVHWEAWSFFKRQM